MAERGCPSCGSVAAPVVAAGGQTMCPACHEPLGVHFILKSPPPPHAGAPGGAPRHSRGPPVLPPLRPRPVRRRGGSGALLALFILLLAAFAAFLFITRPWEENRILPLAGSDVQAPQAPEPSPDGTYHREYEWEYGGSTWTFTLHIPVTEYARYHAAERPTRLIQKDGQLVRQMAYDVFVTTPYDDAYIQQLADELRTQAQSKGWSDDQTLSFALAFVQSLPYATDDVTTGFDEYPRYPMETLVDDGGDCEDTAILYASLVQALGYGAVLLSPPGHMAVGVQAESGDGLDSYLFNGHHYLYAETTGSTWEIGEAPPEYQGKNVQVFDLVAKPLFDLRVTYGIVTEGNLEEIELNATAIGSASAVNLQLVADVTSGSHSFDLKSCHYATVRPGEVIVCRLKLDLGLVPCGQEIAIKSKVVDDDYWYARADSAPWVRQRC